MSSTLRCAEGRGDEPLSSDTPKRHPKPMLTRSTVAATTRQHKIHGRLRPCEPECLEMAEWAPSKSGLGIETGGGESAVGRWAG